MMLDGDLRLRSLGYLLSTVKLGCVVKRESNEEWTISTCFGLCEYDGYASSFRQSETDVHSLLRLWCGRGVCVKCVLSEIKGLQK